MASSHVSPGTWAERTVYRLVNLADKVKSPEILSMLMEYQRLHFPSKRRSFEL